MDRAARRRGLFILLLVSVFFRTSAVWAGDECWTVTPDRSLAICGDLTRRGTDVYAIQQALKANGIDACIVLNHGPSPVPLPAGALAPGENSIIYSLACQGAMGPNATAAYLARLFPGTPVVGFQDLVNFGYNDGVPWIGQSRGDFQTPVAKWGVRLIVHNGTTRVVSLDPAGALPGVGLLDVGPNGKLSLRLGDESFPVEITEGTTAGRASTCGTIAQPRRILQAPSEACEPEPIRVRLCPTAPGSRIGRIASGAGQTFVYGGLGIGSAWAQQKELQLALDPKSSVYNDAYHSALRVNYEMREEKFKVLEDRKSSWWERLAAGAYMAHYAGCSGRFH